MFSILSRFILCDYVQFTPKNLQKMIKESGTKPTFVVAYYSDGGEGERITEQVANFRRLTKERHDFYFSPVDCSRGYLCYTGDFRPNSIPYFGIVQGPNIDSWPTTENKTADGWLEFVNDFLQPKAQLFTKNDEIENLKKEIHSSTLFILHVSSKKSKVLKEYEELARKYNFLGCRFIYKISKIQSLVAYTSPHCMHKCTNLMKMSLFVNRYKFGALHRISSLELEELSKNSGSNALYIADTQYKNKELPEGIKNDIIDLADAYCDKLNFGWAVLEYSDKFKSRNNIDNNDLPLVVYFDDKCVNKYQGRLYDTINTDFLNISLSGQICGHVYNNMDGSQSLTEFNQAHEVDQKKMWWQKTITGFTAHFFYLLTGFLILLYVVISTPMREKSKFK